MAGRSPFDVAYRHGFFLRVPGIAAQAQSISSVGLELCDHSGKRLFEARAEEIAACKGDEREQIEEERDELLRLTASAELEPISLDELRATHTWVPSPFWKGRRPRGSYLGP